jgi:NAD(P)-dependent dehydrogenase (short-subunit alcohol dehydrogenase family)
MDAVAHGSLAAAQLFSVAGRVALVTGGGRGIGEMIARALAANGARVYIAGRAAEPLARTAARLSAAGPGACVAVPADLATDAGCRALAEEVAQREAARLNGGGGSGGNGGNGGNGGGGGSGGSGGSGPLLPRLDILVNNAGTSWGAALAAHPEAAFDKVLALNLKAPFHLTRACRPMLEAAAAASAAAAAAAADGVPPSPARVVNVGSIAGLRPQSAPTWAYDASKAALHALTAKLAAELAPAVTVNALAPGYVPTRMSRGLLSFGTAEAMRRAVPMRRFGGAADMGGAALFLCSEAGAWVTGSVLVVDGGSAAAPMRLLADEGEEGAEGAEAGATAPKLR